MFKRKKEPLIYRSLDSATHSSEGEAGEKLKSEGFVASRLFNFLKRKKLVYFAPEQTEYLEPKLWQKVLQ